MAKESYNYADAPVFLVHSDGIQADGTFVAIDGSGETLTIKPQADDVVINGVSYYNAAKVDALLSDLNSTLRSWASSSFAPRV